MGPSVRQPVAGPLRPVTSDSGALIAIERGDTEVRALARVLATSGTPVLVPAPAVAEAWRGGAGRQARLAHFLNTGVQSGHVQIIDLDYALAKEVGMILGRVSMSVTDALVCRCALLARGGVVTSDPGDIQQIIPRERIGELLPKKGDWGKPPKRILSPWRAVGLGRSRPPG